MNYGAQLKKIRRFLRDPNGNIWGTTYLKTAFNDIQREIQHHTGFLEKVEVLGLPPLYQFSYMFDWEWRHLPSDQSKYNQCLNYYQQGAYTFCNRWEMQTEYGGTGTAEEAGCHFTQQWEAWAGLVPGETIKVKFPEDFYSSKLVAYDYVPLFNVDKKKIASHDASYIARMGTPIAYYMDDELDNDFVIYPAPSTVVWNDVSDPIDPEYIYTYSWEESDAYITGIGATFLRTDSDNSRQYIFVWEIDGAEPQDYGLRGMYLFETGYVSTGQYGMVVYVEDDTTPPLGTYESRTGTLFSQDEGIAISVIDADDNVLLVYDSMAADIQDELDTSDFPEFMQKYIECGVLERSYSANTDGRIQSLKDYWGLRYQTGIEMMKRYMRKRTQDRDYRLITSKRPPVRRYRHPRLPDGYPAI